MDDWLPDLAAGLRVKGKTLGLPLEVAVRVLVVRSGTCSRSRACPSTRPGAPAKVDYRQVEEMAQRLTCSRGDPQIYGLFVTRGWCDILIYVYGFGGAFLDADHTRLPAWTRRRPRPGWSTPDLVARRRYGPAERRRRGVRAARGRRHGPAERRRAQNLRRLPHGAQWDTGPVVSGPARR